MTSTVASTVTSGPGWIFFITSKESCLYSFLQQAWIDLHSSMDKGTRREGVPEHEGTREGG